MPYHVDPEYKDKANKSILIMSSDSLFWIIVLTFNWCQTCFVQKFERLFTSTDYSIMDTLLISQDFLYVTLVWSGFNIC